MKILIVLLLACITGTLFSAVYHIKNLLASMVVFDFGSSLSYGIGFVAFIGISVYLDFIKG